MINLLKYIALVLFTAIFIIAVSGVFFINHHCNKSVITDLHFTPVVKCECNPENHLCCENDTHLNKEQHCEIDLHNDNDNTQKFTANEKCCEFSNYFIKVFSPFYKCYNFGIKYNVKSFDILKPNSNNLFISKTFLQQSNYIEPPPEENVPVHLKNSVIRV